MNGFHKYPKTVQTKIDAYLDSPKVKAKLVGVEKLSDEYEGCERYVIQHESAPEWNMGVTFDTLGQVIGFEVRAPHTPGLPGAPTVPVGGLTRRKLQALPLRHIEDQARSIAVLVNLAETMSGPPGSRFRSTTWVRSQTLGTDRQPVAKKTRARTTKPKSEDHTLKAALIFARCVETREHAPYKIIAREIGYSRNTAAVLVRKAREAGYLTETTPTTTGRTAGGAARGELTDYGRAMLTKLDRLDK